MDRARIVFNHLKGYGDRTTDLTAQPTAAVHGFSPDDVVIVSAKRTPICKSRRGGLKDTLPDDMLSTVFRAVLDDSGLDPKRVGDICVGNCSMKGAGASVSRRAQFYCNIPETVPMMSINRACSSGLQACMNVAGNIKAGFCDVGIGAGVESMTLTPMNEVKEFLPNPRIKQFKLAQDAMIPMGVTSENVAERFGISRFQQDQMACQSHEKAHRAQTQGLFDDEIIPVHTILKDKAGNAKNVVISKDDGIRPQTNMQTLAKLRAVFREGGSTTAGNASQTSDGAAAVILARRSAAEELDLPILGVLRSYAVVGVPPDVMGIGPAYAIPEALKKAGLTLDDIDVFEINEAFASQATYCVQKLGIPMEKVNPKGGAIALGHPLGCTGARQIATLLHELKRRGERAYGVVSMCMGFGMGAAAVFEFPGK